MSHKTMVPFLSTLLRQIEHLKAPVSMTKSREVSIKLRSVSNGMLLSSCSSSGGWECG
jgi:hypothetical protein